MYIFNKGYIGIALPYDGPWIINHGVMQWNWYGGYQSSSSTILNLLNYLNKSILHCMQASGDQNIMLLDEVNKCSNEHTRNWYYIYHIPSKGSLNCKKKHFSLTFI